jgi:hypothetical protein
MEGCCPLSRSNKSGGRNIIREAPFGTEAFQRNFVGIKFLHLDDVIGRLQRRIAYFLFAGKGCLPSQNTGLFFAEARDELEGLWPWRWTRPDEAEEVAGTGRSRWRAIIALQPLGATLRRTRGHELDGLFASHSTQANLLYVDALASCCLPGYG